MRVLQSRSTTVANGHRILGVAVAVLGLMASAAPPAAATPAPAVTCGQLITSDIRLTADLVCPGDALTVQGNLVLDLHGHRIRAAGTAITVVGDGSPTIRSGSITDSATGLRFAFEESEEPLPNRAVTVSHVRFSRNQVAVDVGDTWVQFLPSRLTAVTITHSRFQRNGDAITGSFTGPVTVLRSTFTGNGDAVRIDTGAISLSRSVLVGNTRTMTCIEASCDLRYSRLRNNANGLSGRSSALTVKRSTISGSDTAIEAWVSTVDLTRSRIIGNATGVSLTTSSATLSGNSFRRNGTGFTATDEAEFNSSTLTRNSFVGNGDGIFTASAHVAIGHNLAVHNRRWGIFAPYATDLGGNRAHANGEAAQCAGVVCVWHPQS